MRGVTFQPVQAAGPRSTASIRRRDRLTLTEVRRRILEQTTVFRPEDVIPVPCHPDALAMAYALKIGGRVVPLTGLIDPEVLIDGGRNTIVYEQDDAVRGGHLQAVRDQPLAAVGRRHAARAPVLPAARSRCPATSATSNIFRVIIMQFIDAHAFDVRSVKKTCVHIVHPTTAG